MNQSINISTCLVLNHPYRWGSVAVTNTASQFQSDLPLQQQPTSFQISPCEDTAYPCSGRSSSLSCPSTRPVTMVPRLARYIRPIYIIDIYPIFSFKNIFVQTYRVFSIFSIFIEFFLIFLMWHIVTTFWFSVCVFCWLMTCALSIFSVLDNFCQISPLHSNEVWITRVLHLICNAHTHTIIW